MSNHKVVLDSIHRIQREVTNRTKQYYRLNGNVCPVTETFTIATVRDFENLVLEHIAHHGFAGKVDDHVRVRLGWGRVEFSARENEDTPFKLVGKLQLDEALAWLHAVQHPMEPLIWDHVFITGCTLQSIRMLAAAMSPVAVTDADQNWFWHNTDVQRKVGVYITRFIREYQPHQHFPSIKVTRMLFGKKWQLCYEQALLEGFSQETAYSDVDISLLVRIALFLKDVSVETLETRNPVL